MTDAEFVSTVKQMNKMLQPEIYEGLVHYPERIPRELKEKIMADFQKISDLNEAFDEYGNDVAKIYDEGNRELDSIKQKAVANFNQAVQKAEEKDRHEESAQIGNILNL